MKVRAWSTSANLGPGFDVMGIALKAFKDVVEVELGGGGPDALVTRVNGPYSSSVPIGRDNVAAFAAKAALMMAEQKLTAKIKLWKGVPPRRGLGSSGASSAAVVKAINLILGDVLSEEEMIKAAAEGERAASGHPHPDNVAPSLLGGLVIVGERIVKIEPSVKFVLAIPWIDIPDRKTEAMRSILPRKVGMGDFVANSAALAMLVLGMTTGDLEIAGKGMSSSMVDKLRSKMIPGFKEVKEAALRAGALGSSISGAGPSMLFLCDECEPALAAIRRAYISIGIPASVMVVEPAEGAAGER